MAQRWSTWYKNNGGSATSGGTSTSNYRKKKKEEEQRVQSFDEWHEQNPDAGKVYRQREQKRENQQRKQNENRQKIVNDITGWSRAVRESDGSNIGDLAKQAQDFEYYFRNNHDKYDKNTLNTIQSILKNGQNMLRMSGRNLMQNDMRAQQRQTLNRVQPSFNVPEKDSIEDRIRTLEKERDKLYPTASSIRSLTEAQSAGDQRTVNVYNRYNDVNEMIEDLRKQNSELKRQNKLRTFNQAQQSPDYAERSQYRPTANGRQQHYAISGEMDETGFTDYMYDYINKNPQALFARSVNSNIGETRAGTDDADLLQMTEQEVGTFNYLYSRSRNDAFDYIDSIRPELRQRQAQAETEQWSEFADQNPVLGSVLSVPNNLVSSIDALIGMEVAGLSGEDIDPNAGYFRGKRANNAIRQTVGENVGNAIATANAESQRGWEATQALREGRSIEQVQNEILTDERLDAIKQENFSQTLQKLGNTAYGSVMSQLDNMMNIALTGGAQGAALALMSMTAMPDAIVSAKEQGLSDKDAFSLGVIAGAAEYLTEKVSMEALFDMERIAKDGLMRYVGINALTEGSEEVASDFINFVAQQMVAGEKSDFNRAVKAYQQQGMSHEEAVKAAWADQVEQAAYSFIGGALAGGGAAVGFAAGNQINQDRIANYGANIRENLAADDPLQNLSDEELGQMAVDQARIEREDSVSRNNLAQAAQQMVRNGEVNTALTDAIMNDENSRRMLQEETGASSVSSEESMLDALRDYGEIQNERAAEQNRFIDEQGNIRPAATDYVSNRPALSVAVTNDTIAKSFGEEGQKLYNEVANRAIERGMTPTEAYQEISQVYNAGNNRQSISTRTNLPEADVNALFKAGYQDSLKYAERDNQNASFASATGAGVVENELIESLKSDPTMSKNIDNMNIVAQALGIRVTYVPHLDANGIFNEKTKEVQIAADADPDATMAWVFGHEMTHRLQQSAPVEYNTLKQAVQTALGSGRFNLEVQKELNKALRDGVSMTQQGAQDEAVANYVGELVRDRNALNDFIENNSKTKEGKSLLTKIRDFFRNLLRKLSGAYGETEITDNIQQTIDALTNAIEAGAKNVANYKTTLENNGVAATDDFAAKFSLRTWNDKEIKSVKTALKKAGYTAEEIDKWISDVNGVAAMITADRTRLDYEADEYQVALKDNEEYYKTLDLSTLCKKRLLYQGTYNAIMHKLKNSVLAPEDTIMLRRMMDDLGYEVPCGICYEESRKKNEGIFAERWLNGYEKWKGYKNMDHNDPYIPTLNEVTTTDGRAKLRKKHPEALESYLKYQRTRGSANPKVSFTHTEYRGDIRRMVKQTIDNVKHIGGLRVQSFSDFETIHVIDMMQAIVDMASKHLTAQAYTKVPAFADIFGGTGIKINLSLIGQVNENGELVFDPKEGINPDEAFRIREKYSDNVGTILVGANNDSILAAWADPRIDMVIPFHRSGWSGDEFERLGLKGYDDFTDQQSERYLIDGRDISLGDASEILGQKLKSIYTEDYWDYSKTGKENAEAYLKLCAEKNYRPVFYKFLHDNGDGSWSLQEDGSTDGYWKSLTDYKMYNNEGVGAPQQEVRPNFDMEAAKATMDAYDGNPNTLPVAKDVVTKFVKEYKKNHKEVKMSRKDSESPELTIGYGKDRRTYRASQEAYDFFQERKTLGLSDDNTSKEVFDAKKAFYAKYQHGIANEDTFYKDTMATFQPVTRRPSRKPDYVSKTRYGDVSSEYWYTSDGVVRGSKHWGFNISTCDWELEGHPLNQDEVTKTSKLYGRAKWTDFVLKTDVVLDRENNTANLASFDNSNVRFSSRDSEYIAAVDAGDMETAQRMVDEAAKEAGYTTKAYHGTGNNFTVFDKERSGKNYHGYSKYGKGLYFADSKEQANRWGKNRKVLESYLDMKNPYTVPLVAKPGDPLLDEYNRFRTSHNKKLKPSESEPGAYLFEELNGLHLSKSFTTKFLQDLGYDGIIVNHEGDSYTPAWTEYVVFDAEQIKSADPVTYDGSGNVIPLSERFNRNNEDIRYSRKDSEYLELAKNPEKNREQLQRMVDEAADKTGYVLSAYHGTTEYFNVFKMGEQGIHLGNEEQAKQVADARESRSKYTFYEPADIMRDIEKMPLDVRNDLVQKIEDYSDLNFKGSLSNAEDVRSIFKEYVDDYEKSHGKKMHPISLRTYDRPIGKHLMKLYARLINPFVINGDILDWNPYGIAEVILSRNAGMRKMRVGYTDKTTDITGSNIRLYDYQIETLHNIIDGKIKGDDAWEQIADVLDWNGYDGIQYKNEYEGDKKSYSYIALRPSDVKSADLITYDNDGNIIPLSERFNRNNNDIRYSRKDSEGRELSKGQMEYFKDSKVRDENGNLKVMYHGSENAGFTIFDPRKSDDKISLFFTDFFENAREYSGSYDEYTPDFKYGFEDLKRALKDLSEDEAELVHKNGKYQIWEYFDEETGEILDERKMTREFDSLTDAQNFIIDEFRTPLADIPGNYVVYLNIENPLVIDADGAVWDEITAPKEMADEWGYDEGTLVDTRDIAEYAHDAGYDGVIINNVYDNGKFMERQGVEGNIAIAFSSEQVKSIYNLNPTENEDYRYSRKDSEGRTLSDNQQEYFKDSKVRDDDGNLMVMYHGTPKGGFTIFNPTYSQDRRSLFFSDKREVAKTYGFAFGSEKIADYEEGSRGTMVYPVYLNITKPLVIDAKYSSWNGIQNGDTREYTANRRSIGDFVFASEMSYDEFNEQYDLENLYNALQLAKENGEAEYKGEMLDEYELEEEWENVSYVAEDQYLKYFRNNGKYITAKEFFDNPQDYGWYDLYSLINTYDFNAPTLSEIRDGQTYEEAVQGLKDMFDQDIEDENLEEDFYDTFQFKAMPKTGEDVVGRDLHNTRWYAKKAQSEGYDGVIIKNLYDSVGGSEYSTVAIAFNSNQVKSVNNLNPTENDDFRFSRRSGETMTSLLDAAEANYRDQRVQEEFMNAAKKWRTDISALNEIGSSGFNTRMTALINSYAPDTEKKTVDSLVGQIRQLTKTMMRNPKISYAEIADQAGKIAAKIMWGKDGITDNLKYNENAAQAVEDIRNDMLSQIIQSTTKGEGKYQRLSQEFEAYKQKSRANIAEVRRKRDEHLEKIRQAKIDAREKRHDSADRTKLLNVMRRLDRIGKKSDAATRDLIQSLIGDYDLIAKSLTDGKAEQLSDLGKFIDDMMRIDADFMPSERTIKELQRLNQKHIADMDINDVRELTLALLNLEHELKTYKQTIDRELNRNIHDLGEEVIDGVEATKGIGNSKVPVFNWFQQTYDKTIATPTIRPETEFLRITGFDRNNPLYDLTFGTDHSLASGQRDMVRYKWKANQKFFEDFLNDREFVNSIMGKKARACKVTGRRTTGETVTLKVTPDLLMALYMHSQNDSNFRHFGIWNDEKGRTQYGDGITIPDFDQYRKGNLKEAYRIATRDGNKIQMTKTALKAAVAQLTEKEMKFVRAAQRYYSEMSQPEINKVSTKLLGYEIANVENYFRINTDQNYRGANLDAIKYDGTIEGMGWTKERTGAKNAILLIALTEQLQRDIDAHSKYIGLALPVRNFNKVYGVNRASFNDQGEWTGTESSVQAAITGKWGDGATDYINKLMSDIQNPKSSTESWNKIFGKLRSFYAGSVLALNAGVAIKQAASYPTAAAEIGWIPLIKAFGNTRLSGKLDMNIINQYSPLMYLRTQGMGYQELVDLKNLSKGALNRALNSKALNWIQDMDIMTVKKLWKAAEYYVRSNFKDLEVGSADYYKKVGEIHSNIIERTQPNYTTLQRGEILRSDSDLIRTILGMFKTQPFQNFSILFEATGELNASIRANKANPTAENKAAIKAAGKKLARAISSQVIASLVFALMQGAWDWLRGRDDKYKDEEGNLTFDSAFKQLAINMGANAFGMIPLGGVIYEVVEKAIDDKTATYGLDASTATGIVNDIEDAIFTLMKNAKTVDLDSKTTTEAHIRSYVDVASTALQTFGYPADNFIKDGQAVALNVFRALGASGMNKYLAEYYGDRVFTAVNGNTKSDYMDILYRAYDNDKEAYNQLYNIYIENDGFGTKNKTSKEYIDEKIKSYEANRQKEKARVDAGLTQTDLDRYESSLKDHGADSIEDAKKDEIYETLMQIDLTMKQKETLWAENEYTKDKKPQTLAEYDAIMKKKK